jgi:hypothetical protein
MKKYRNRVRKAYKYRRTAYHMSHMYGVPTGYRLRYQYYLVVVVVPSTGTSGVGLFTLEC